MYSEEVLIASINQKAFTATQAKTILAAKGVEASEAQQIITTAGLSSTEKEAATSTLGLGKAFKGLGVQLKTLATAHPILLAITATIGAIGAGYKIFDLLTVSVKEAKDALEDNKSAFESVNNEFKSVNTELDTNKKRIEELNKLDKLTYTEKGELDNLKATSEELRIQLALLEKKRAYEKEDLIEKTVTAYNKEFNGDLISNETVAQKKNFINDTYSPDVELQIPEANLDLSLLVAQYQKFNEVQLEALDIGDEFVHNKFSVFLNEIDEEIWEQIESLTQYKEILTSIPYDSLSTDAQDALAKISNNIEYLWKTFDPSGWNALQFDNLFDIEGVEKTKDELIELQTSGQLDLSSYPVLSKAIANLNLVLDDGVTNSQSFQNNLIALGRSAENSARKLDASTRSLPDILHSLPIDKLEELIALFKSGTIDENTISSYDELNAIIQETELSAEEAVKALKEFSDDYTLSSQLISDMDSTTTLIAKLKDEIKQTGTLGVDSLSALAKQFPELEYAVSQFNQGLISTDDLIALLQTAYESDADAFRTVMSFKLSGNETFFATIKNNNHSLFENLAKAYNLDVDNWKTLAQAKAQIDQQLIQNLSSAWSKYYNIVFDSTTGLASIEGGPDFSRMSSNGTTYDPEIQIAWSEANKQKNKYNQIIKQLNEAAKIEIDVPDFGGIKHEDYKDYGAGKDKKESTPRDYDWIQRALEAVQRKREALQKQVDDETNSYHDQISALQELIERDEQFISVNETALNTYTSRWKEIQKQILSVFGDVEGNNLISKIVEGDLTKEGSKSTYAGKQAETLDEALDIYDSLMDAEKNYSDSVEEKTTHLAEEYKKRVAEFDAYIDQFSNKLSQAQSNLDLKEVIGRQITEADYKELIGITDDQIDIYYDKLDALNDRIASLDDEGSPEYYSLKAAVASCEQAISDAEKSQAKWNEEIKNLPIRKIERYLELLGQIKQDLTNYIDEQNVLGINTTKDQYLQLIDISQQQLEELLKQQDLLKDKLGTYQFNSDKYNETASSLQDIDDEISDLIQSQYEWNKSILQIPLDSISKTTDTLQNAVSAMSNLLSDYDTAISAVTNVLDKQIDSINGLKDAASDEYETKIKPFQDELDLLQKQNDARRIQLDLEQAAYDLARAQDQKTNKVIRDGEITYEADEEAIRSAQNAKNDADYNKVVHDLKAQISGLEEERDKLLEGYDLQIEKLDEIKDRWSSITEEIKLAADSLKADDILGAGWQDKILSGSDAGIFNSIKDLYTTISDQKNQYEQQITSNKRITDMMNQFMESWQNGSITYDQAMAGIKDLAVQMKDGYSSLEHLDALMNLNGATDLGTLLSQMQNSADASVNQFEDYMKVVKENADALEKYNSSWEEMQQNIRDQIAALEKLAKEAEKVADNIERHSSSSGSGGGSKGPNTNDKSYVNAGPGRTDEGYNNAVANGQEIREYHKGGVVGGAKTAVDLKNDEVFAKLEMGERVITHDQQEAYKATLRQLLEGNYSPAMSVMPMHDMMPVEKYESGPAEVNISMGDITLPNVTNVDEFVHDFGQHINPMLSQAFSKVFR